MRRNHSHNFAKSLPSLCADVFSHKMQTVLPHRDRFGRRVFLFRAGIWDPNAVSPTDVFAANYICLEMMASEVKTQGGFLMHFKSVFERFSKSLGATSLSDILETACKVTAYIVESLAK